MHLTPLIKGFAIGFAIAAPVGPIGVLCIRRTIAEGRLIGFLSGLGAATADASYGAVAAFGLTAVQAFLVRQQSWLHILGAIFLAYLGISTFLSKPPQSATEAGPLRGRSSAYLSTLGLTLTNPATIVSFLLVFTGLRIAGTGTGYGDAALLTAGVFAGSAAWWLFLSSIVGLLRGRFSQAWLLWTNRLAGALIFAFAVAALASA